MDGDNSNTSECLMLMRDIEGKRVSLKVALTPASDTQTGGFKQGIITQNDKKGGELKLRSIVTDSIACVPKNYKVG
jgi:hypothetical protein